MTHFQAVPESGDAIVILTNSQRSWPFIAYLLRDWAAWRGFPALGMERIIWGHYGLSAVIGMLLSAGLLMVFRLRPAFRRHKRSGQKLIQAAIALLLLGLLTWCACRDYLFLTSVFPVLSLWLGAAILIFAIVLLISAVIPGHSGGE